MKPIIVLHAAKIMFGKVIKCPDAVAALWAFMKTHPDTCLDDYEIVWQPYLSEDAYKKFKVPFDYKDRDVYFFDFCYPEHIMQQIMYGGVKSLTALDHHEPRKNILENLSSFSDKALGRYGQNEDGFCGATLVWNHYTDEPLPWFMNKVWERDTGANGYYEGEILQSEAFNTWLSDARRKKSMQEIMDLYDYLYTLDAPLPHMEDITILEEREKLCESQAQHWESNQVYIKIKGWIVPFIKIQDSKFDKYYSHAGRKLRDYKEYPFVVIQTSNELDVFHLRGSENCPIHLGFLAESLGGGGHKLAGGFTIGKDKFYYITPMIQLLGKISDLQYNRD